MRPLPLGLALLCCAAAALPAPPARAHEDHTDTLARLDETIAAAPLDPEPWRSRAIVERRRGRFARAHADLTRAVELGLDPLLVQRDRGSIWLAEGRFAEAEAWLRAACERAPDDPATLLAHARALAGLEHWREAADGYARLLALAPRSSPDVHLERVRALAATGGDDAALEALRAAEAGIAALGPVPALEQAALDLELRAGRTDAALARLDRMAGSAARESLSLQRAAILEQAGSSEAASQAYADALAALDARAASRRATPAAREMATRARDGIARLARDGAP